MLWGSVRQAAHVFGALARRRVSAVSLIAALEPGKLSLAALHRQTKRSTDHALRRVPPSLWRFGKLKFTGYSFGQYACQQKEFLHAVPARNLIE